MKNVVPKLLATIVPLTAADWGFPPDAFGEVSATEQQQYGNLIGKSGGVAPNQNQNSQMQNANSGFSAMQTPQMAVSQMPGPWNGMAAGPGARELQVIN